MADTATDKESIGTLYFIDPNADLSVKDVNFCTYNIICSYTGIAPNDGDFDAFANLPTSSGDTSLKTVVSVGGATHDATFESTFASGGGLNKTYSDNFVNSAVAILEYFRLSGIDLDYENIKMTPDQAGSFAQLVAKLSKKIDTTVWPDRKPFIDVTILANQDKIKNSWNFSSNNQLKLISEITNVRHINLMTYDFHGAFDYQNYGKTGLISNVYKADGDTSTDPFSVQAATEALIDAGVAPSKITVGIPAYGRAMAGIPAGASKDGYNQEIPGSATVPPGEFDLNGCVSTLPQPKANACTGIYSYQYLVTHMLKPAVLTATDRTATVDGKTVSNGTSAFGNWSPTPTYSLEVSNLGKTSKKDLGLGGIKILIGNSVGLATPDKWYLAPGAHTTFNNITTPNTKTISGKSGLRITWQTSYAGGPSGSCVNQDGTPTVLNFTQNAHLMITVNTQGQAVCDVGYLPAK